LQKVVDDKIYSSNQKLIEIASITAENDKKLETAKNLADQAKLDKENADRIRSENVKVLEDIKTE
jgi:hypothetical protein